MMQSGRAKGLPYHRICASALSTGSGGGLLPMREGVEHFDDEIHLDLGRGRPS
jgi:hypothetical protein